jgi:hypothetical protein
MVKLATALPDECAIARLTFLDSVLPGRAEQEKKRV